jgi:hypothetical protein
MPWRRVGTSTGAEEPRAAEGEVVVGFEGFDGQACRRHPDR